MKKAITFFIAAFIFVASFGQKKEEVKGSSDFVLKQKATPDQLKNGVAEPVDTITIDLVKYRFIKIGEQVHDLKSEVPLFVPFQWIIQSYDFMNSSKSGLSKTEIEQLQSPLLPFWQMYVRQLQAQQQKGQKEK